MSKYTPSLLERAAEVYDFAAALRAPEPIPARESPADLAEAPAREIAQAPPPAPETAPALPEPIEAIGPVAVEPILEAPVEADLVVEMRPAPIGDGIVTIDHEGLAEKGFIVPNAPVTGLAEEFRIVKRQLLAGIDRHVSLPEEKRRAVLVSSGQPGEGKSFCAANLALSLAGESDVEVLLVDGDFTKPDVLNKLGIPNGPGLVELLADPTLDPEDFVIRTDVAGLSVLPAGRKANNVPELLASDRTRELLARLVAADRRRIILFDSPPALMASPASVLAAHVGQVLVVVRADRTTEADLRETVALLGACDHVGLLLNGAGIAVNGRKFGGYEGYGHGD
jgi:exopolysaccharide/PEP-CTERM locus tyrosine autokinase